MCRGMNAKNRLTVLCLASFFKGNRFFQRLHEEGCYVILITSDRFKNEDWAREYIHEFHSVQSFEDRAALINGTAWLFRDRRIDRIVALDDFDVEVGAALREHFRIPGHERLERAVLPRQAGHAGEGEGAGHPRARASPRCSTTRTWTKFLARGAGAVADQAPGRGVRGRHQEAAVRADEVWTTHPRAGRPPVVPPAGADDPRRPVPRGLAGCRTGRSCSPRWAATAGRCWRLPTRVAST